MVDNLQLGKKICATYQLQVTSYKLHSILMLSFTHTIISLPLAYYFENPLLIFVAAVVVHLLADTFLHWNLFPEQSKRWFYPLVALEVAGGLAGTWLLVGDDLLTRPVFVAIAGGNAPDVVHQLWELLTPRQRKKYFAWARPLFTFHSSLQAETFRIGRGLISQIIFIAVAIFLLGRT